MSDTKKDRNTGGDPLWYLVLNEIRSSHHLFAPTFGELSRSAAKNFNPAILAEYEYLLCQIDDALELSRPLGESKVELRKVHMSQVAEDLAEAYERRFGPSLASVVSLLVDHEIPVVKSRPDVLLRIIDCMVRKAHGFGTNRQVEVSIRGGKKLDSPQNFEIIISSSDIGYLGEIDEVRALLAEFNKGIYFRCLNFLGLELCAAFHMARQLGGTVRAEENGLHSTLVEIVLTVETAGEKVAVSNIPEVFYVYSRSKALTETLDRFAAFHGIRAIPVSTPSRVSTLAPLVFDAREIGRDDGSSGMPELREISKLNETTLILPSNDPDLLRSLANKGFSHFITLPLVSTKLIKCLAGLDGYVLPVQNTRTEKSWKLRVLVVDDAATARIVLKDHFEAEGHTVVEASDGIEFVELIKKGEKFDIVFCDLTMCRMDGVTAVKALRDFEKGSGQHTPVVLMTAYSATDSKPDFRESICDLIIYKPIDSRQISEIVHSLIFALPLPVINLRETQIIDLEDLRSRCSGKTTTMIKVLESFIEASRSYLPKLQETENPNIRHILHTLKGLMRDAGAKGGAQTLQQIENNLREEDYNIGPDLKSLEVLIETACSRAEKMKEELKAEVC